MLYIIAIWISIYNFKFQRSILKSKLCKYQLCNFVRKYFLGYTNLTSKLFLTKLRQTLCYYFQSKIQFTCIRYYILSNSRDRWDTIDLRVIPNLLSLVTTSRNTNLHSEHTSSLVVEFCSLSNRPVKIATVLNPNRINRCSVVPLTQRISSKYCS